MNAYSHCTNPYIDAKGIAYACGQCPNCRRSKSTEWIIRARHELITQPKAVFITLSYDREHLTKGAIKKENRFDKRGILVQKDFQDFMKRLRKHYKNIKLKYLYCGEYGEKRWRPHYHAVIWGIDPTDIDHETLNSIWKNGDTNISQDFVTENAIAYIVGYVRKKIPTRGKDNEKYENNNRPQPYLRASQGLGGEWCDRNRDQWTTSLSIGYKNAQYPVPRYYIKRTKKQEGITIRHETVTKKIGQHPTVRHEYKTFENPYGHYTRRINEEMYKKYKSEIDKWMDTYKLKREEYKKISTEYINTLEIRDFKRQQEWLFVNTHSEKYVSKLLYKYVDKTKITKRQPIERGRLLSKETEDRLNGIAKRKEYEYKHGLYGKRDVLEFMEELNEREI
jgi:hypothetical protein